MSDVKIGLALGSGAARGWAHIGVIRALQARGLTPHYVAGVSMGSLVGGALAMDELDTLEEWVRSLTRLDVLRLLDTSFRGGVMAGNRVMGTITELLSDRDIESLPIQYGAVAADLNTGREIWLRSGSLMAAVRASCGLPGLFSPRRHQGSTLR